MAKSLFLLSLIIFPFYAHCSFYDEGSPLPISSPYKSNREWMEGIDKPVVALDTETTGKYPLLRITEMALIVTEGGEKKQIWQAQFNSLEDFARQMPEWYSYVSDAIVVGHNISYDKYALDCTLRQIYNLGLYPDNLPPLTYFMKDTLRMVQRDRKRTQKEAVLSPSPKKVIHSRKRLKMEEEKIEANKTKRRKRDKETEEILDIYALCNEDKSFTLDQILEPSLRRRASKIIDGVEKKKTMEEISRLDQSFKGKPKDLKKHVLKELNHSLNIEKYIDQYLSKKKQLEENKENKLDLDSCLARFGIGGLKDACKTLNLNWKETCEQLGLDPIKEVRHSAFYDTTLLLALMQQQYEKNSQEGTKKKEKRKKRKINSSKLTKRRLIFDNKL